MNEYLKKTDILTMLDLNKSKWLEIKGNEQDITRKNFIDNVILVYEWIIGDVEKM